MLTPLLMSLVMLTFRFNLSQKFMNNCLSASTIFTNYNVKVTLLTTNIYWFTKFYNAMKCITIYFAGPGKAGLSLPLLVEYGFFGTVPAFTKI